MNNTFFLLITVVICGLSAFLGWGFVYMGYKWIGKTLAKTFFGHRLISLLVSVAVGFICIIKSTIYANKTFSEDIFFCLSLWQLLLNINLSILIINIIIAQFVAVAMYKVEEIKSP
ncbi:MAG: hypothetical protein ABH951_01660 [Patescibacteria group bacterium]